MPLCRGFAYTTLSMNVNGNPPAFYGLNIRKRALSDVDRKIGPSGVVRPGGACAGQAERRCAVVGTGKPLSHPLAGKLGYLWRSCSGELAEQNDLFRLTYALETAKDMSWTYRLLNDREWSGRYAVALNGAVNGVYLSRSNLDVAFDDNGYQVNPLMAQLTGNVGGVMKLLNRCGWQAKPGSDISLPHQYSLMARQGVSGKD